MDFRDIWGLRTHVPWSVREREKLRKKKLISNLGNLLDFFFFF